MQAPNAGRASPCPQNRPCPQTAPPQGRTTTIGLLDIYGFESFEFNDLEQVGGSGVGEFQQSWVAWLWLQRGGPVRGGGNRGDG